MTPLPGGKVMDFRPNVAHILPSDQHSALLSLWASYALLWGKRPALQTIMYPVPPNTSQFALTMLLLPKMTKRVAVYVVQNKIAWPVKETGLLFCLDTQS